MQAKSAAANQRRSGDAAIVGEVGVIALIPDRWSAQWQLRHHVLARLGGYFPVVWVNPAPGWRSAWRRPAAYRVEDSSPEPGLEIHSPDLTFPRFFKPRWFAEWTMRKRLEGARKKLLRKGCKKIIVYVWRPEYAEALSLLDHDLSCYHIDDEYTFEVEDVPIPEAEQALLRRVDLAIIHSPGLIEKKGHLNPNTVFVPNGVDFAAHADPVPEPADLGAIPRPIIGYTGWLKTQLDWELLGRLAEQHREWSFVLVGAAHAEVEKLAKRLDQQPNVYLLGARSSAELAHYPQHFDVCIMPYNEDHYTRYIYPLKLHEYLASGTATVGTPILSLQAFRSVVRLAREPDQWSEEIQAALNDRSQEARAERQAVALGHDWEHLVHRIAQHMADALGPEIAERVRSAAPNPSPNPSASPSASPSARFPESEAFSPTRSEQPK